MQGIKDSAQQSIADDTEKTNLVFEEYANLMAEDMGIAEPGIPGGAITVESKLKEGDYVYYIDANNVRRKCAVLYGPENENYAQYGLQVISMETVEEVTLGENVGQTSNDQNLSRPMDSYNSAIETLNNATSKYLNTVYATGVRCVGSVPDNPSFDGANLTYGYRLRGKDTDQNYKSDYDQLIKLELNNIGTSYWLASRTLERNYGGTGTDAYQGYGCSINHMRSSGVFGYHRIAYETYYYNTGQYYCAAEEGTFGIRPVFTLKPELKIVSGEGTSESPYLLEF